MISSGLRLFAFVVCATFECVPAVPTGETVTVEGRPPQDWPQQKAARSVETENALMQRR